MRHALIAAEKIVEKYAKAMNYKPPYSLAEVDEVAKIVQGAVDAAMEDYKATFTPELPFSTPTVPPAASKEKPAANGAAGKK